MNVTGTAEKVDKKVRSFVYLPCFLPKLWYSNCPKKCIFCNFVVTSARNLSQSKFTYMHLKVLMTPIQKMVWFVEV